MAVPLEKVLMDVGGEPFEDPSADGPGYRLQIGPLEVEAVKRLGMRLRETFVLSGIFRDQRTTSSLEAELPLEVESDEQGRALLAYFIGPHLPPALQPHWLVAAANLAEHLPWRRTAQV